MRFFATPSKIRDTDKPQGACETNSPEARLTRQKSIINTKQPQKEAPLIRSGGEVSNIQVNPKSARGVDGEKVRDSEGADPGTIGETGEMPPTSSPPQESKNPPAPGPLKIPAPVHESPHPLRTGSNV